MGTAEAWRTQFKVTESLYWFGWKGFMGYVLASYEMTLVSLGKRINGIGKRIKVKHEPAVFL